METLIQANIGLTVVLGLFTLYRAIRKPGETQDHRDIQQDLQIARMDERINTINGQVADLKITIKESETNIRNELNTLKSEIISTLATKVS